MNLFFFIFGYNLNMFLEYYINIKTGKNGSIRDREDDQGGSDDMK